MARSRAVRPNTPTQPGAARRSRAAKEDGVELTRKRILQASKVVRIQDHALACDFIRQRQQRGIDQYDEVWDGVYVVPPLANNPHQDVVGALCSLFFQAITLEGRGSVFPGANVSDRRTGWENSFRCPDVVVVLEGGRAVDCGTHWYGGPDFLVEIISPDDETEAKLPFYSQIQVRELLIVHRVTRDLHLFRHDGRQLLGVSSTDHRGKKWLLSEVLPFAFRSTVAHGVPRTEVERTEGSPGHWIV